MLTEFNKILLFPLRNFWRPGTSRKVLNIVTPISSSAQTRLRSYIPKILPSKKSRLYTSIFCTLIQLYLSCNQYSKASQAFFFMTRTYRLIPNLPSWNQLLCQFNDSGLVSKVMQSGWRMIWLEGE